MFTHPVRLNDKKPFHPLGSNFEQLHAGMVFCLLWLLMFLLYLPAARAGFVTDFTGWLYEVRNSTFTDYINRTHFQAHSLYQFTQLVTYFFYLLFGTNAWLWHLLFITLHVINATLIFQFSSRLLLDAGVPKGKMIALGGVILFCLSPYISEVIVWEPAFHFLQGLLLIMLVLTCTQRYIHSGKRKYAWLAIATYFLSTFSLEVFYITPWLVLLPAVFYRFLPAFDKDRLPRTIKFFFAPMLVLFLGRLALYRFIYGGWVSRIGTGAVSSINHESFGKPAKYLFHLLFLGRFFPDVPRNYVYAFCSSGKGLVFFCALVTAIVTYILVRFRSMDGKGKVASLFFVYVLISLALLIPLWFPEMLLVIYDRYAYFTGAFFYMLLGILFSRIATEHIKLAVVSFYVLANLRFTILVNRYWGKSAQIIKSLLYQAPDPGSRILILLNLPESLNGIPMIGSEHQSEYKLMHDLLLPDSKYSGRVYDGLSYNMLTPDDGAHVTVISDSTVRVTLNQWGTWWWYEGRGGNSYENQDYRLNMIDGGHFYELTLKKPSSNFVLLYQKGEFWKLVDMDLRGADQD